jgi:hypothetical protein
MADPGRISLSAGKKHFLASEERPLNVGYPLYMSDLYTIWPTLPAADFRVVLEPKNAVGSELAGEFGSRPHICEISHQNPHLLIDINMLLL